MQIFDENLKNYKTSNFRALVEAELNRVGLSLYETIIIKDFLNNVNEIKPLIIIKNPNQEELINFLNNTQYKEIRGLIINNDIFIWDGGKAIHPQVHTIIIKNNAQTFPVKIYHEFYIQKDDNKYNINTNNNGNLKAIKDILYSKYETLKNDIDLDEDTVKQGNSWTNKGKEGTRGKFKTKKEADNQRKAMFANGYKG